MIHIGLIHSGKSYLPEVDAYEDYFSSNGFKVTRSRQVHSLNDDIDVEWIFPGIVVKKRTDVFTVHDYPGYSTPPHARLKTWFKKKFNATPDLRIFSNQSIRDLYGFQDGIPYLYREVGVAEGFFSEKEQIKRFDFVYVGSLDPIRQVLPFFELFRNQLQECSLLVVGQIPSYLQKFQIKNVHFTGQIAYKDLPAYLKQCRYGLNLIPNRLPFNCQLPSKLLEYCASQLKVVTTDYPWIRNFEKKLNGRFYKISNPNQLNIDDLANFDYKTPDVSQYKWSNILSRSGIVPFMKNNVF